MSRVVVIGGGVMGCATALELAQRGQHDILLLERAVPGAEASSAAAGMLAAQVEAKTALERDTYVRARAAYEGWALELREATGIDIGYRKSGVLDVGAQADIVMRDQDAGLRAEMLDGRAARAIEPMLAEVESAAWFPDEAQVDPPQLLRALVAAVSRANVRVQSGTTVSSLVVENDRCIGVEIAGEKIGADAVVLAAGSWSSLVPGIPKTMPVVRPMRGQLVMLEERPPRLSTIVFREGGYVVPRGDGRVICGSTMEDVGHRREVTAAGVQAILASALRIAPALGAAEVARSWCNFRPHSAVGPQIGKSPLPGLFLATGHHRNGILLAKITAEAVAEALLTS